MLFSYYDRYQYAVNPLVEVICQLRFPAILSISAKEPVAFQEAVRRDFPRYLVNHEQPAPKVTGLGTPNAKLEQGAYEGAPLHFIGHLQRNKVGKVVGRVALIQSVGSLELLDEIEKVAAARGLVQDILLEVNIGREAAKSGFAPEKVLPAAEAALERTHVRVRGLMTIPPADAQRDANFRYFQEVQALYVDMNQKLFHNELEYLSMGMSGDYEDAIRAGATMVRVGSAIFGARHYN